MSSEKNANMQQKELKKKIINTISEYEKKVKFLADSLDELKRKTNKDHELVQCLLKQGTDSIFKIATRPQDKQAVTQLQQMLEKQTENHAILVHFNKVLTQCISSVTEELDNESKLLQQESDPSVIGLKVHDSLHQLLSHLSIPKDLDSKREHIKNILENAYTVHELSVVLDGISDLVVDAFKVEQNRFKGFLEQLTHQLNDFETFFKTSTESRKQAIQDSQTLQTGIQDNLDQIKNHLDNSKTIEELSGKMSHNIEGIGDKLTEFRDKEKTREEDYEKQIVELQNKLQASEQNAEAIKTLLSEQQYKSNHDHLTGIPNRGAYQERMKEALHRWERQGNPLSIAVCDIDHFKKVNDTFGHLAGDKLLKKVAEVFLATVRANDFTARVGGEEFVFIFEDTPSDGAFVLVEKLRKAIEECPFYYRDQKITVTVSFGVTTIGDTDNMETVFQRADQAMYKAKNTGRNRSVVL